MSKLAIRLGDTVFVAHPQARNNGAVIVPAIVTQLFNDGDANHVTLVNMIAFPPFMTPQHLGSVTLYAFARSVEQVEADPHFVGCWGREAQPVTGVWGSVVGELENAA